MSELYALIVVVILLLLVTFISIAFLVAKKQSSISSQEVSCDDTGKEVVKNLDGSLRAQLLTQYTTRLFSPAVTEDENSETVSKNLKGSRALVTPSSRNIQHIREHFEKEDEDSYTPLDDDDDTQDRYKITNTPEPAGGTQNFQEDKEFVRPPLSKTGTQFVRANSLPLRTCERGTPKMTLAPLEVYNEQVELWGNEWCPDKVQYSSISEDGKLAWILTDKEGFLFELSEHSEPTLLLTESSTEKRKYSSSLSSYSV